MIKHTIRAFNSILTLLLVLPFAGCSNSDDGGNAKYKAVGQNGTAYEIATVRYQMRGKDGKVYMINGPAGLSREVVKAEILKRAPQAGIPAPADIRRAGTINLDTFETEKRGPYEGDIELNYGPSRYGDPLYRYRGEVEGDGYVRLRNFNGDTLRGYVDRDGSVRLRNFDGDVYQGQIDADGSMRLKDYDGSSLSGQLESDF